MKSTFGEITCDTETAERIATWCAPPIQTIVDDPIFEFEQSEYLFRVEANVYFLHIAWTAHHIRGEMICLLLPIEAEQWLSKREFFNFEQQKEATNEMER